MLVSVTQTATRLLAGSFVRLMSDCRGGPAEHQSLEIRSAGLRCARLIFATQSKDFFNAALLLASPSAQPGTVRNSSFVKGEDYAKKKTCKSHNLLIF